MIGERLKQLREMRGYSKTRVAKLLGVGVPAVYQYETNRSGISTDNLVKLAKHYNVTTDWILGIEPLKPLRKIRGL